MQYLRAYAERVDGAEGEPIRFVASTEGVKRDGLDLKANGWITDNYRSNPVVLWVHDYSSPPIAKASISFDDSRMLADVTFDQADEFARQIEGKYRRGFLNTVSVGWDDVGVGDERKRDLLDVSAVPVPADPQALMERRTRASDQFRRWILSDIEDAENAEDGWAEVASRMVGLFRQVADDAERLSEYRTLERQYRKLDKVPPEFMTNAQLAGLGAHEVRGLFLEGESDLYPEQFIETLRLTRRQMDKVQQALDLLQEALAGAEVVEDTEEPQPAEDASVLLALKDILAQPNTTMTGDDSDG